MLKWKTPMNAVRRHFKSSSKEFWECKLFLQDPAAPDLPAEEVWRTSLLLAVSTQSYTFFVPVRRCSFLEKSVVSFTGCSREDSSGLPWSRSSKETGNSEKCPARAAGLGGKVHSSSSGWQRIATDGNRYCIYKCRYSMIFYDYPS